METPLDREAAPSLQETYSGCIEKARKEFPALIKRMSNTISEEQKSRLIDPDTEEFNPDFSYPNLFDLDGQQITAKSAVIEENLALAQSLEQQGITSTIANEFDKEKALDGLIYLRLLRLAQGFQQEERDRAGISKEFIELNNEITGPINPVLYQGIVNDLHEIIGNVNEQQPRARKIADELAGMVQEKRGDSHIVSLPDEVFNQYQHAYKVIFGEWLNKIVPEKKGLYSAADMAEVYSIALEDMKLDQLGWHVVIDEEATSMRVSMEDMIITMPSNRKALSHEEFAPKIVHEIGHITRGLNGSYISRSAEHGLPEYLDAEEGLMSYGEEFISGKRKGNITYIERYLGTGMMTGVDGVKKDFKQVFATMWHARVLLENADIIKNGHDLTSENIANAKENSLMNAQRLFRGGDGKTPGVGWTKDKAYYEGVAKLTDFLVDFANKKGVENIHWLFTAKFDPTNSLHNQYLQLPLK